MLLGCYGWIAHAAMLLSQHLGGSLTQQACFGGLLGAEAWALLDMVGARLLWWTWHNDEPLYADREGGVPVASSFWILASMGSLPLTLRYCCPSSNPMWGFVAGPLATLGLMHLPFLLIFHPLVTFLKLHAAYSLWILRLLCTVPLVPHIRAAFSAVVAPRKKPSPSAASADHSAVFRHLSVFVLSIVLIAIWAIRPPSVARPSRSHASGTAAGRKAEAARRWSRASGVALRARRTCAQMITFRATISTAFVTSAAMLRAQPSTGIPPAVWLQRASSGICWSSFTRWW